MIIGRVCRRGRRRRYRVLGRDLKFTVVDLKDAGVEVCIRQSYLNGATDKSKTTNSDHVSIRECQDVLCIVSLFNDRSGPGDHVGVGTALDHVVNHVVSGQELNHLA